MTTAKENTQLAIEVKSITDIVGKKIKDLQESGELHLPANYSASNAMKSAWLILQSVTDRNSKPALTVCTKDSIANSLLRMVTLGLNPEKKQGYFIVYGEKLSFDPSYFGDMHIAKQVDDNIYDFFPEVVYEGDVFEYEIKRGKKVITKHQQSLGNVDKKKIMAAYCIVAYENGSEVTTIMTIDEIKDAWRQSKMNPIDEKGNVKTGSTHDKFSAEMCKRTVIRKACKPIINSSDDRNLLIKKAYAQSSAENEVAAEIEQNANQEYIDITPQDIETDAPGDTKQMECGF